MKQYSKPITAMQLLAMNTFVCGVSSVNGGEQPSTSPQLAPRGDVID
jgi:hypothetical protein